MAQGLLVDESIDAGRRLLDEFNKIEPVKIAAWLKESDNGRGYLYIVSDQIDGSNFGHAYGEVLRLADPVHDPKINPFRVRIIPIDSPGAQQVTELQRSYPRTTPPPVWTHEVGGVTIDDVYVYHDHGLNSTPP